MSEAVNEPDARHLVLLQPVPEISEDKPSFDWRRAGKIALGASAVALGLLTPATRAVTAVENMPPTHVPMTVGGAEVDAQLNAGEDTIKLNLLGHDFVHPSPYHLLRKHYGVTVNFHTESSATSLLHKDGTLDNDKVNTLFSKFSDATPQEHEIARALTSDVTHTAEQAALHTLEFEAGLAALLGLQWYRRRSYAKDQREASWHDRKPAVIATAAALGVASIVPAIGATAYYWAPNHHQPVTPDSAFNGTPMQGWAVNGPFAGLIDVGWKSWSQTSQKKNEFYGAELANFHQALIDKYNGVVPPKAEGTKRILFADDLQGMDGPTLLIGAAAKAYGVDAIVLGGDTEDGEITFTSVLDSLYDHADGIPVLLGTGIHDPANIAQLAKRHGFTPATNKPQEVAGLNFLAVADASRENTLAIKQQLINKDVTDRTVASDISNQACSSSKPVIVVVHDSRNIGNKVAATDCAPLVLKGREYFPPAPIDYGNTVAVTSGSTGGHTFGEGINVTGIIAGKASFSIIDVDAKTEAFLSMTTITLNPIPVLGGDTSTPSTAVSISGPLLRSEITKQPALPHKPYRVLASKRP